ncbi:uncharacterized protein [Procambarus clarkii]|uniref:uncharacterized protein n=1 Tax=Procambarus clarkii TaxID=6728 RepID=UPI003742FF04
MDIFNDKCWKADGKFVTLQRENNERQRASPLFNLKHLDENGPNVASDLCTVAATVAAYLMYVSGQTVAPQLNSRMCEMVKAGKLNLPKKPPEGMNMTSGIVAVLTTAVNTSLKNQKRDCPMLYTRVGQLCLALFSPAKVPWPEARQFCRSIYGDLVMFDNLSDFEHLVLYMRNSRLTTDYWVGGRFDLDTNAWSWTVDESVMPLGTPYWAVRHSSSCVPRPPPHTDPFSSPSAALPDALCLSYTQAPANRQEGWCSALTYEHYYYMTDQSCQEERSPLCMLEADDDDDQLDEEPEGKV